MWSLPPPSGFQGLNPDKPLSIYWRHLPHWRQAGATYFVTFHLGESLPASRLRELAGLRDEWERRHPSPRSNELTEQFARETMEKVHRWLDQGFGECLLKQSQYRAFLVETLHHFDATGRDRNLDCLDQRRHSRDCREMREEDGLAGRPTEDLPTAARTARYELGGYVIMPNHVHAILRPLNDADPLEEIVGTWKQYSSLRINRQLGKSGARWHEESCDRIIRDEEHLWRVIQYIGRNPGNAGLAADEYSLWVRPEWEKLGWTFEAR